ncbi:Na/Pi cotransporter family protein [Spirochaeta isovalerica]|uniref:Phosphate:Na+ symporter n=1 Tax=Spirochaeta isovalerica TaxID=150 RepID=A0A841RDQ9_9SPIO|nr:Na/Pi cotransporter family protein [Spirochaeta isovalerica]MBB6482185.1 phosphate:Na+ symporter [Spirochaeta isovalerica]
MFIVIILEIIGSLGVFLFGMKIMSDGIQKAAGEGLQNVLNRITANRFVAVFTGFFITAIVQSSSATTVMVVGFVNAGLLTLTQSIGVIMGANIGTTVTGWIVSLLGFKLKISALALEIIAFGLPLYFSKKETRRYWGEFLIGFGILFIGLDFLKKSVPSDNQALIDFITPYTNFGFGSIALFVIFGAIITIIVHSSSASMTIVLTMAASGLIGLDVAAAMIMGSNIGTTIDAYLASIGATTNAKRAARVHLLFNVFGVLVILVVFRPFLKMIQWIVPGDEITTTLAMFHTIFNITNTFVFIGFVPQIARLIEKMVPEKESDKDPQEYHLDYFSSIIQDTPELNLIQVQKEVGHMTELVEDMFKTYLNVFSNPDKKMGDEVEKLRNQEDFSDQMQEKITSFLLECSKENLNETGRNQVSSMIRIVSELESIGDSCFSLIMLSQKKYKKKIPLHDNAIDEVMSYSKLVDQFLQFIKEHINNHLSADELEEANNLEDKIDSYRNKLRKEARKQIKGGADVKGELLYIDIIRHMERIGDYCLNIAQTLRRMK